jgi:branched-subunit amino acid ABC-type transport system permease component
MNWNLFVTELVAGIVHGSVYALIALGYSMVYGILKLLNFAHGEVFMIGSYIGYFVLTAFGGATSPDIPVALLIALMFAAAMLGSGGLGVAIERFAYRPLRVKRAPRIAPLISALGVSFCLQQIAVICFGATPKQYNTFSLDGGIKDVKQMLAEGQKRGLDLPLLKQTLACYEEAQRVVGGKEEVSNVSAYWAGRSKQQS